MSEIPSTISEKILSNVKAEIIPDRRQLLLKVFVIHLLTAVVTLSICPQFGISTFKMNFNLMHTFMVFGMSACYLLCGAFFTASSVLMASFVLKRDEIRALRFQKTLLTFTLLLSSVSFFLIMKPELFIEFALLWLIGAIVGSVTAVEVSGRILQKV
jgi:hypothetical protein